VNIVASKLGFVTMNSITGSSYVERPIVLTNRKDTTNMINDDSECFQWRIIRFVNHVESHHERINKILCEQSTKFRWLDFPMKKGEINKWDRLNLGTNVNVYDYVSKVYPSIVADKVLPNHIELLLYNGHKCLVKDFSRLVSD